MLSYFVRYRDTIKLCLFVTLGVPYTPVMGFEGLVQYNADNAFNARLRARLED
jgi:hypothetical protein